jgi:Ca2+-binding EF-hand superfamily protein
MAFKLTLDEINTYKDAFKLFESDGRISQEDLNILMRSLGQNFSNEEFRKIKNQINDKANGYVEFHEFLDLMATHTKTREGDQEKQLIMAFRYFDRKNEGMIDYFEMEHVLCSIAEALNEDEMNALREKCEVDEDGRLDYEKFIKLLLLEKI